MAFTKVENNLLTNILTIPLILSSPSLFNPSLKQVVHNKSLDLVSSILQTAVIRSVELRRYEGTRSTEVGSPEGAVEVGTVAEGITWARRG